MRCRFLASAFLCLPFCAGSSASPTPDRLAVHEWGTFTVLQDEQGKPIGGINTDDEPVPSFVHNLQAMIIQNNGEIPPPLFSKGWPTCDRDVYVRLETPVIYFHLPPGSPPIKCDVDVSFNGGWLTQFYPNALANNAPPGAKLPDLHAVSENSLGTLAWHDLTVGGAAKPGPITTDKVWLAPRKVDAADVRTPAGESERYLFYRGIGHLKAPLSVSRDASGNRLLVHADWGDLAKNNPGIAVGQLWLMDVRADGSSAMRSVDPTAFYNDSGKVIADFPATFADADYSKKTTAKIRRDLHATLMHDGLFSDEADALLDTWDVSYFQRPGTRLFFMVPPVWTQHMLPLRVSQSAMISRAMVGRIELVTPAKRALLRQIAAGPASVPKWIDAAMRKTLHTDKYYNERLYQEIANGSKSMLQMNIEMPVDFRAYLELGRFRNALILEEAARRPTPALLAFIKNYSLQGYWGVPGKAGGAQGH